MTDDLSALGPIPRMDPADFVAQVNAVTGVGLVLLGGAASGENGGAAYVRWPDGQESVAKRSRASLVQVQRVADVLARARTRGIAVPRYELVAGLPNAVAIVQERLPGAPARRMDRAMVEAIVTAGERFADLLPAPSDVPRPSLHLTESGPGHCLHETLENYDARTRQLLAVIRAVGDESPRQLAGDDLVHLDFTIGNVLFDEAGALTGIVDWDNIGRGDRRFALMQLRFDLGWSRLFISRDPASLVVEPAAIQWLDEHLEKVLAPATLRAYWAHWSLHMIDWTIRHGDRASVEFHLDLAANRLGYEQ